MSQRVARARVRAQVRAARSVFRVMPATLWGFGVGVYGFCAAGRRPRPLTVESIAHFERRSHDGGDLAQREWPTSRFAAV